MSGRRAIGAGGEGRILWVATADARGHVMRAQLLGRALFARGIDVDVVTTSDDGAAFLAAFGVNAPVLSRHYRVEFDGRHNIARLRTDARIVRYLFDPNRLRRDLRWLVRRADGADLVINDSNHPALLLSPLFRSARGMRVVHVYGQNLRRALERNFEGRAPRFFSRAYAAVIRRLLAKGYARIEHTFDGVAAGVRGAAACEHEGGCYRLPPVIAAPTRGAAEVRASLGVGPFDRLAVVYLNPHFREPAFAAAVEEALGRAGFAMYAIGEGYAGRPRWRPHDPQLIDAIAAADLYVSGAGMGALGQARAVGVPFLSIVTDQPEQVHNLAFLREAGHPFQVVRCDDVTSSFCLRVRDAALRLADPRGGAAVAAARPDAGEAIARTQSSWLGVLTDLVRRARRDQEPALATAAIREEERQWRAA